MAAVVHKYYAQLAPNCDLKMAMVVCTSAADGDTLTISPANIAEEDVVARGRIGSNILPLQVVMMAIGTATDGTALQATVTGSSNVITLVNGGTNTWNILIVGY